MSLTNETTTPPGACLVALAIIPAGNFLELPHCRQALQNRLTLETPMGAGIVSVTQFLPVASCGRLQSGRLVAGVL